MTCSAAAGCSLSGLLLFSAASLAGGLATSQAELLVARAVQGAGGAIVTPTALALVSPRSRPGAPGTGRWVSTPR